MVITENECSELTENGLETNKNSFCTHSKHAPRRKMSKSEGNSDKKLLGIKKPSSKLFQKWILEAEVSRTKIVSYEK
ncbi:hypothetical protein, partial [Salinarimonas soli]|uniref:hypothetical protein n=1 Tax=Salinarimonas soli TaxID=1638099 RepID=UPI001AEF1A7B